MFNTMPSHDETAKPQGSSSYVSTKGAADSLGVTESRIRQLLLAGDLIGFKVQGERGWKVEVASVERYREYLRRIAEARKSFRGEANE